MSEQFKIDPDEVVMLRTKFNRSASAIREKRVRRFDRSNFGTSSHGQRLGGLVDEVADRTIDVMDGMVGALRGFSNALGDSLNDVQATDQEIADTITRNARRVTTTARSGARSAR